MSTAETPENKPNPEEEPVNPETPEAAGAQDPAAEEPPLEEIPEEIYQQHEDQGPAGDDPAARIAALEQELADSRDQMLRALAEQENTRKRLLKDREDLRKYAISDFGRDLLDFSDNFKRALQSIPEELRADETINNVITGIEAMRKDFLKTMEKHGITKIEPMGEMFDPNFHEAMFEAPGTGQPAGTIIELVEPGYLLHDRLLRAARVGIAKDEGQGGGPPPSQGDPGGQLDTEA